MEIKAIFMYTTNDTIRDTVIVVKVVVNNFVDHLSLGMLYNDKIYFHF